MFSLEIDDREHDLIPMFNIFGGGKRKTNLDPPKRLTWFDFAAYWCGELSFGIERKTWDDLAASIKDGRLDKQLDGMALIAKQMEADGKKPVVRILLIEGQLKASHGHIDASGLIAKLDHVMFNKRIDNIMYCRDAKSTVARVYQLIDNFPIDLTKIGELADGKAKSAILSQVKEPQSDELSVIEMLTAIKGVSWTIARLLVKNGWSILDLMNLEPFILSETVFSTGHKMGLITAKKISDDLGTKKCWINMLANINGITKLTAVQIMDKYPIPDEWVADKLSLIEKSEKKKVGPVVASRILKLIRFKVVNVSSSELILNIK